MSMNKIKFMTTRALFEDSIDVKRNWNWIQPISRPCWTLFWPGLVFVWQASTFRRYLVWWTSKSVSNLCQSVLIWWSKSFLTAGHAPYHPDSVQGLLIQGSKNPRDNLLLTQLSAMIIISYWPLNIQFSSHFKVITNTQRNSTCPLQHYLHNWLCLHSVPR